MKERNLNKKIICPICQKEVFPDIYSSGIPGGVHYELRCPKCYSFLKTDFSMVSRETQIERIKKLVEKFE